MPRQLVMEVLAKIAANGHEADMKLSSIGVSLLERPKMQAIRLCLCDLPVMSQSWLQTQFSLTGDKEASTTCFLAKWRLVLVPLRRGQSVLLA